MQEESEYTGRNRLSFLTFLIRVHDTFAVIYITLSEVLLFHSLQSEEKDYS